MTRSPFGREDLCDLGPLHPALEAQNEHWPKDRYLELAPKYWAQTLARLHTDELDRETGHLTVPPLLPTPSEEQTPT